MPRSLRFFIAVLSLLLIITASYFLYMQEQGNFHAITLGEAYRSSQLDRDELEYYIRRYNIRSILNLRGRNPGASWYMEELKVSAENNVTHYDIAMSASHEPTNEDIRQLMVIFKTAPRPVLIHCQAGADRSGLVAAMWKVVIDKKAKAEAEKQLSIFFWHLPVGPTTAMDRFFQNWKPESN